MSIRGKGLGGPIAGLVAIIIGIVVLLGIMAATASPSKEPAVNHDPRLGVVYVGNEASSNYEKFCEGADLIITDRPYAEWYGKALTMVTQKASPECVPSGQTQ